MKLRILVDNNTYIDQYYFGEPAVSYYIEDEGHQFLLDTGYSDIFIKNSELMGIDLNSIEGIVISHGHDDHTKGLDAYVKHFPVSKPTLIAHTAAFNEKSLNGMAIGSPLSKEALSAFFNLNLTDRPIKISPNLTFLGKIPRMHDFEASKVIGLTKAAGVFKPDFLEDDSALVYQNSKGLYIITGCSHSGICNIIEYAKEVTGCQTVISVVGGFHLFEIDEQVMRTLAYLKEQNMKEIYPCHCTSFKVRAKLNEEMDVVEVGVGLELEW